MNNKTPTYREKGRAVFLAAIMVLSVVAMSAAFTGAAAALNDANISVDDVSQDVTTTNDDSTYSIDVNITDADADGVDQINLSLADNGEFGGSQPELSGVTVGDVSVSGATVGGVSAGGPTMTITLDSPVTYTQGETVEITLDGVVNPDTPTDDQPEIGATAGADVPDVSVGFEDTDGNQAVDTLADAYSIEPSVVVNATASEFPRVSNYGANADVSVTLENQGESDVTLSSVNFSADDTEAAILNDNAAVETTIASSVTLGAGNSTTLEQTVTVSNASDGGNYGTLINATDVQNIYHGIQLTNAFEGGAAAPFAIGTDSDGKFTVQVFDDNSDPVPNTDVELWLEGDFDAEPLVIDNQTTNSEGRVTFTGLAVGDDENGAIRYTARAAEEDPRFSSTTTTEQLYEPTRTSAFSSVTVNRLVFPDNLDITQSAESAIANFDPEDVENSDTIVFDILVEGTDGEPFENADVTVEHDGSAGSINFVQPNAGYTDSATVQTDENGEATIEVGSTEAQAVNFDFSVEPVDPDGEQLTETRTKNFVRDGEGYIEGYVQAADMPDPENSLEDARVWTVQKEIFDSQAETVPTAPTVGDTWFYRLVDNSTGEVLSVDNDYRIDNDGQNSALQIARVNELNTTNAAVGSGWVVRSTVANPGNMFATVLETGEYRLERSQTAPNASDDRFVNESAPSESFTLVKTFNTTEPLTYESAQDRSNASGQELADMTDQDGQYILQELFTDFQSGVDYTVVATHSEYDTRYADATVTEDGAYFENRPNNDFVLFPVDVQPGFVNITNVGVHPPLAQTGGSPDLSQIDEFDDPSDETEQTVPRDNSVDVLQVTTRNTDENGNLANATVSITVPDDEDFAGGQPAGSQYNFSGQIVDVLGGELVDDNVVHTGDDFSAGGLDLGEGEAIVLLEADQSSDDLSRVDADNNAGDNSGNLSPPTNETGVFAQLTNDDTASDFTNKSFPGVIAFQSGSISGKISNDDELLPNTFIWTSEFQIENGNTEFEVNPNFTASPIDSFDEIAEDPATANDQVSNLVFDFLVIDTSGGSDTVVEEAQVTGEDLKSIDLADTFGSVSESSASEFNLLRSQSEHNNGDYSMDQVPAIEEDGVNYRRLSAYQYGTADSGNGSTAEPVRPGFTVEGNVVIVGAAPVVTGSADRTVDSAELAPGESTQVTLEVDLSSTGDAFIQESFDPAFGDVEVVDADGADFANVNEENNELVASWGDVESATLVYEVNVSQDASAGDSYTLTSGAESDFDAGSDVIDVVDAGPSVADYANDDGVVDTDGLQDAIADWRSGVIDTDLLQNVIDAWRTGEVVTESPA